MRSRMKSAGIVCRIGRHFSSPLIRQGVYTIDLFLKTFCWWMEILMIVVFVRERYINEQRTDASD